MGLLLATGALEKKEPPKPKDRTLFEEGKASLDAQAQLAPIQFANESEWQPKFADLYGKVFGDLSAGMSSRQRAADVSDVEQLGGRAMAAFRNANPDQAGLLDEMNRQAMEDLKAGGKLTPGMRIELQQNVRAGQAARGMGYGKNDLLEEVTTMGSAGEALRGQRRANAANVFQMNNEIANVPFMSVLGRSVTAMPMAAGAASQSLATQDPFNQYAQDLNNTNFNAAWTDKISIRNYNAAIKAALIGAIGSIVGGAAGGAAGGA